MLIRHRGTCNAYLICDVYGQIPSFFFILYSTKLNHAKFADLRQSSAILCVGSYTRNYGKGGFTGTMPDDETCDTRQRRRN